MNPRDFLKLLIPSLHGWGTLEDAYFLYDLTVKHKPKIAVEIGIWGGRTFLPVAMAMKENGFGKAIGIDPWDANVSAEGQTTIADYEWWSVQPHETVYQHFLDHMRKVKVESFCDIRRAKSDDVEPPKDIDLLHIDGNHGPQVIKDVERFAPNVRIGGFCLMDDVKWSGGNVEKGEQMLKGMGFHAAQPLGEGCLYQRIELKTPVALEPVLDDLLPTLTVAFITARKEPKFEWFLDSIANQIGGTAVDEIIIVDAYKELRDKDFTGGNIRHVLPKPTVWQGKHRLTKADWWAASNARNTALCLCQTDWIAFLDDRCVIMPGWLDAISRAMRGNYIVAGSYQKRSKMVVESGFIKGFDKLIGNDSRIEQRPSGMEKCPGQWLFGCNFALPLEAALQVNGFDETCDGSGSEDTMFGLMLSNAGYQINFDPSMRIIEDRTEGEISAGHGVDSVMHRKDKGVSPNDKSHALLNMLKDKKRAIHQWDLRKIRDDVLKGGKFPIPTLPDKDFFDQQPLSEMTPP